MIPDLIDLGSPSPYPVLPPGIHDVTMQELENRFATTPHRRWLFDGFQRVVDALALAGCATVYIDGSFTTDKAHPDDFDGCWDHKGVDFGQLDPVLLTFVNKRAAQKAKYLGEMFPAGADSGLGTTFLDFFQVEKYSGLTKGILRVSLAPQSGMTP